jgi:hypothetical protein
MMFGEDTMPPILVSPLVKWAVVALGGAAAIHWVVKEVRRVTDELNARRAPVRIDRRERLPTLRRDPATGEYRPY